MDENIEYVWEDKLRHFGLPISFTRYRLSKDRLFYETGFLNIQEEELMLYRVQDIQLRMSVWQRLFNTGTIRVHSSDRSTPHLDLVNIADPRMVKEEIHNLVENAKLRRRMRSMEVMGDYDHDRWASPEGVTADIGGEDEEFPD